MITSRRKLVLALDHRITQTRMNDQFNKPNVNHGPAMPDRRKFLVAGLGLAAASLLTHVASGAPSAKTGEAVGMNPVSVRAYGATSAATPLGAMQIERRAIGANVTKLAPGRATVMFGAGDVRTPDPCQSPRIQDDGTYR
jgi:hypothetical protein